MPQLLEVECQNCGETLMYDPNFNKEKELLKWHSWVCPRLPWKTKLIRRILRRKVNF